MFISKKGLDLIKEFEGLKLKAYLCPAGIPTIGYGHTQGVKLGMTISEEWAEKLLVEDIWFIERGVEDLVHAVVNQNQFDALCSFAFNVGLDQDEDLIAEGLGDSTLLKLLNRGMYAEAAAQFPKWCNGRVKGRLVPLPGLVRRREAERKLFLSGSDTSL